MKFKLFYIMVFALLLNACEGGLEPKPASGRAFIKGVIKIKGTRPSADSLKDLRAVALREFPTDSLFAMIISGRADFSPVSLPMDLDEFQYELEIKSPPAEIKYFGIAYNYGNILDWRPCAVYGAAFGGDTTHTSFTIQPGETKTINFTVDFGNLPYNPFTP